MHAICAYFWLDAVNVFQNIWVRGIKRLERMCTREKNGAFQKSLTEKENDALQVKMGRVSLLFWIMWHITSQTEE